MEQHTVKNIKLLEADIAYHEELVSNLYIALNTLKKREKDRKLETSKNEKI